MNDPKTAKRLRQALDATATIRKITDSTPLADLSEADWQELSRAAGELQRRSRILGGLGRGG